MIFEFDWNRGLFVARSKGPKKWSGGGVNRPNLTFAVSPKYLSNETKIYIFISRIPRVVYIIFGGFFQNFIFPTSGRYLQTSALKGYINMVWRQVHRFQKWRFRSHSEETAWTLTLNAYWCLPLWTLLIQSQRLVWSEYQTGSLLASL